MLKVTNEKGITLVALIITIIVLIILAAVTIVSFKNSNLIGTAINGTINYANAQADEAYKSEELAKMLDEAVLKISQNRKGDSEGNEEPLVDKIKSAVSVIPEKMKIKINVSSAISAMGINQIQYKVTPAEGVTGAEGTINLGESAEIITTTQGAYTVKITATDNSGNVIELDPQTIETSEKLSLASVKSLINASNQKNYIGEEVSYSIDGTWRIFYFDETGEDFGTPNTLYIKRDYDDNLQDPGYQPDYNPTEESLNIMKKMNPQWTNSTNCTDTLNINERTSAYFCDQDQWASYKAEGATLVLGTPSLEMFMKSYNIFHEDDDALICEIGNENGYKMGAYGTYDYNGEELGYITIGGSVQSHPMYLGGYFYIASPSCLHPTAITVTFANCLLGEQNRVDHGICPVVAFN